VFDKDISIFLDLAKDLIGEKTLIIEYFIDNI